MSILFIVFFLNVIPFFVQGQHTLNEDPARTPRGTCNLVDNTTEFGGWCLTKGPTKKGDFKIELSPGRPFDSNHVVADPGIAKTLVELIQRNESLIDLGAGIGQYQVWFMENNITFSKYLAYDGAINIEQFTFGCVRYLNLALPISWYPHEISDWAMSLEVGEHIPGQFEETYLSNLDRVNRKGIILSWAVPKQAGHSHVNRHTNEYVQEAFRKMGYIYDNTFSELGRQRARYRWFRGTFMVFRREEKREEKREPE